MSLSVIIMDSNEKFIQFLDNELLNLTEKHETYGLRTLNVEYNIDSINEAKELFRHGYKLWVSGDNSLTDCLYVINSNVEKDLFQENKVTLEAEEVLVELNYAPPFLQTDVTRANGFTINKQNSQDYVTVNYYALDKWFGDFFQIGIVQECLTKYVSRISPKGIMSKMELLRFIEDETGNVFRTRYEKDPQTNIIHRYLDFLNPDSSNTSWELFIDYDIPEIDDGTGTLVDENGDVISTDSLPYDEEMEDVEDDDDLITFPKEQEVTYYSPEDLTFRILNKNEEGLGSWNGETIGVTTQSNLIRLAYNPNSGVTCQCNGKTFAVISDNITDSEGFYIDFNDEENYPFTSIANDPNKVSVVLDNHSIFQVLANDVVIHEQTINPLLGDVHSEVLDLGYNLENVQFDVDESDTFNSIMPILSSSESHEGLSKEDMDNLIERWVNLQVNKGDLIPMIVQKVTTTGKKTTGITNNYYSKPYNANDNPDNNSYEYWAAVAYRTAPFNKNAGEPFIYDDTITGIDYTHITSRPDINETRGDQFIPKIGPVETSDEDPYAIYNDVANKLKDKKYPNVTVNVDVANYKNKRFNDYQLWDKVYLKLPGYEELITARVNSISKNSNDLAENNVTLGTYSINTIVPQTKTILLGDNVNFDYPASAKLTVQLKDYSDNNLANKLVTFSSNSSDQNASPNAVYNVTTDNEGKASITMKYNPGQYTVSVYYGGDELYEPVNATFEVSVGGTIPEPVPVSSGNATKIDQKSIVSSLNSYLSKQKGKKVSNKNNVTTKVVKQYWSKCGKSPKKDKVIGIGHYSASASEARKYGLNYRSIYRTVFKNKCPSCGREGTLVFDGKSNKCINTKWHNRGYKVEWTYEHGITCYACDADYDCTTGLNTDTSHSNKLKMLEKPKKSSSTEFKKLVTGKLVYDTKTVKVKKSNNKKVTEERTQPINSGVSKKVKEKALKIVKKKKNIEAAKAIAAYMGSSIRYEQVRSKTSGFTRSPENVLSAGMGNCCSQTRLMLELMDAAGVTDKYYLYYIHIHSGSYGHVFARLVSKKTGKGIYVDPCKSNPWGHYIDGKYGHIGSCPSSRYPKLPF